MAFHAQRKAMYWFLMCTCDEGVSRSDPPFMPSVLQFSYVNPGKQSPARSPNTALAMQIQLLSTYHPQFGWQVQYFLTLYSDQSLDSCRHDSELLYGNDGFLMAKPRFAFLARISHRARRGRESGQDVKVAASKIHIFFAKTFLIAGPLNYALRARNTALASDFDLRPI